MIESVNKEFHNNASLMFYHLDPRWCSHTDFDYMIEQGYVNALRLTMDGYGTTLYGCKKAAENGMPVWIVPPIFLPKLQTIDEYMKGIKDFTDKLEAEGVLDAVIGFQWDEPLLKKGHTNEALLEMTRAYADTYGKRLFTNFSLYEIAGKRGNDGDPDFQWLLQKDCSKYLTDVGFDLYGWDLRPESQEKLTEALTARGKLHRHEPFKSGEDYYQYLTDLTLSLVEDPDKVKFWYYPCAYNCRPAGGIPLDEGYCAGHLEGFKNLLLKQKNPGGLCVYTYKLFLETHLHRKNSDKWMHYDEVCKNACKELTNYKF